MPTYVALLRAVNLGGSTQIAMGALRDELGRLGLARVRSILQSGNLVFDSPAPTGRSLEELLETAVARDMDFRTEFFVRSAREWSEIIARNPFKQAAATDPARLVVTLLKDSPPPDRWTALAGAIHGRESVANGVRHGYFVYPDGMGRSKVTAVFIERHLGTRGTSRNWNTVRKLETLLRT